MKSLAIEVRARFLAPLVTFAVTMAMTAVCLLTAVPALHAQATDGTILGVVSDPANAPIPNATVMVTDKATGVKHTATTNETGDYRINNVPVGTYDVDATSAGMMHTKLANVAVELNRTSTVNFKMQIATTATTVDVSESAALLDTSTAQLQSTFKSDLSLNLPSAGNYVNDTGVLNLSLLAPGVTQGGGVGYGTGPSVGGQRPTNNGFNIDGVANDRHDRRRLGIGGSDRYLNSSVAVHLQERLEPEPAVGG